MMDSSSASPSHHRVLRRQVAGCSPLRQESARARLHSAPISEFESYVREPLLSPHAWPPSIGRGLGRQGAQSRLMNSGRPPGGAARANGVRETCFGRLWIIGAEPSAADVAIYPFVATFQRATTKAGELSLEVGLHPLGEICPRVRRWMGLVEALPVYERTYPPALACRASRGRLCPWAATRAEANANCARSRLGSF